MRKKATILAATLGAGAVLVTSGAFAQTEVASSTSDLTLVHIAGQRDMTISSVSGGDFAAVAFGTVRAVPFLANVTDVLYDRVPYQLNASLTNLYPLDPTTLSPDCGGDFIPSARVSVDFPASDALALTDISTLTEPVVTLTGTLSAATQALAAPLGLDTANITAVLDGQLVETVQNEVAGAIIDDISALIASLPLRIANGLGGAFTAPLPHAPCGGVGGETAVGVQDGAINDLFALDDLIADLTDALNGADSDLTVDELEGTFDPAAIDDAIRAALIAAGADPAVLNSLAPATLTAILDAVAADLLGTIDIPGLLGQSGSYTTLAELVIGNLDDKAGGLYGGKLEFTLLDLPEVAE